MCCCSLRKQSVRKQFEEFSLSKLINGQQSRLFKIAKLYASSEKINSIPYLGSQAYSLTDLTLFE